MKFSRHSRVTERSLLPHGELPVKDLSTAQPDQDDGGVKGGKKIYTRRRQPRRREMRQSKYAGVERKRGQAPGPRYLRKSFLSVAKR